MKFKLNDTVRVLRVIGSAHEDYPKYIGKTGRVSDVRDFGACRVDVEFANGKCLSFMECELEAVEGDEHCHYETTIYT